MEAISLEEVLTTPRRFVIVDTSLLLLLAEGVAVIDQLEEWGYTCLVTPTVLKELKRLSGSKGKKGKASLLALKIVEKKCKLLEVGGEYRWADDEIAEISLRYGLPVATADRGLRRRLRGRVPTLYYRESQRRVERDDSFI